MKKKVIKALFMLFLLFAVGGGFAFISLRQISNDLRTLVELHRVEIIRQDLVINVQNVQSNLFTVGTGFGKELDEIVGSVVSLDKAINKCSGCHHRPAIKEKLDGVRDLIGQYKEALSAYITTTANEQRVKRLKMVTARIGDMILAQTRDMAFIANIGLQRKTERAVNKVVLIQKLIIVMMLVTMFIALIVAAYLTRLITLPLGKLSVAAKEVAAGNLGYTTDYTDDTEFGGFASAFNEMSKSLRDSHEKILSYTNRLSMLTRVTVALYSSSTNNELLDEAVKGIKSLINAERVDIILMDKDKKTCSITSSHPGKGEYRISEDRLSKIYEHSNRRAAIHNEVMEDMQLLSDIANDFKVDNFMVVWLRRKEEFSGALRIINRANGRFDTEDLRIVSIFANNFTVALDNIHLYGDLKKKIDELKEAQQQLVQAAKLTAIGQLASNVAHEINNPLTSILGFAELIRDEQDIKVIMRDIDIIQQESLRARDIVKQLLEFSRKRSLELKDTDINEILRDVLKLAALNVKSTGIIIKENYKEIPYVLADGNQLKQVFINFINNGIAAMGREGVLNIETGIRDSEVYVSISDTGGGIDKEVLPHIFEPFFTTKADKGTGLGLSVSYNIIDAHGGRINVKSEKGQGTRFTIVLPVRKGVLRGFL